MRKITVWQTMGEYCVTDTKNYHSYIQNSRSIYRLKSFEFDSFEDFISWCCRTFIVTEDEIEIAW